MSNPDLDPVAQAIAQAAQQAAATPASTSTAVAQATGTAVAMPNTGGAPVSMETLMMGSMSVDGWLKPKEYGLNIGDNPALITEGHVWLDMTDGVGFVAKHGIKGGNPAQYAYTTDNATASGGGTWEAAIARIRALEPKASPYRAVDLPFTVIGDMLGKSPAPGAVEEVVAKDGQRLGYTTSTTNWANWETFYREVKAAGLLNKKVHVIIGSQRRTNSNKNVWGVMTFKLVGEFIPDEAE